MSDVTRILSKIESGDQNASEELLPLVYDELRQLAAARMANERADHTLQATALVHEAYVRLVKGDHQTDGWHSRGHFFSAAAEAMRRILVENARRRNVEEISGARLPLDELKDASRSGRNCSRSTTRWTISRPNIRRPLRLLSCDSLAA